MIENRTSNRYTALVLCVLAVLGAVAETVDPAGARAASRRGSQPPTLGADNVVVGSSSAMVTVRIPKDAHYTAQTGENPDFVFTGGGRFVGVFLVQAGGGLESDGVSLFVGRYSLCGSGGCKPGNTRQFLIKRGTPEGSRDGEGILPAGDYRLIFLTDGAPARVRLRFDGLTGKKTLKPQIPIDSRIIEPEAMVTAPQNLAYADGGAYDFNGIKGLMFSVLSIEGDALVARRFGNCIYRGDPPLPPQLAYLTPECPGGLSIASVEAEADTSSFRADNYSQTIFDPGRWGFGAFHQTAGLISGARSLVVSADLPPSAE